MSKDKGSILMELNRIAMSEIKGVPVVKHECCFCGITSDKRVWLSKHVVAHLRKCMPVCDECGKQHIPDYFHDLEEILESHTEMVVY